MCVFRCRFKWRSRNIFCDREQTKNKGMKHSLFSRLSLYSTRYAQISQEGFAPADSFCLMTSRAVSIVDFLRPRAAAVSAAEGVSWYWFQIRDSERVRERWVVGRWDRLRRMAMVCLVCWCGGLAGRLSPRSEKGRVIWVNAL